MQRFLTRGTVSSVIAIVAFGLSASGHSGISAFIQRPEFTDNLLMLVGTAATIIAGVSDGIKVDSGQPVSQHTPAPPTDPYPGYDYDPLRGWVKTDDPGNTRAHL